MKDVPRRRIIGVFYGTLALFSLLGPMRCLGQTLTSVSDPTPPLGQSYFLGFEDVQIPVVGEKILDVTIAEAYSAPLYAGAGLTFTRIYDVTNVIGGMDITSRAAAYSNAPGTPATIVYTSFNIFSFSASTLTYISASIIPTVTTNPLGYTLNELPSAIAIGSSGQMYIASDLGIQVFASNTASLPTLTFANSGPGQITDPGAMTIGPGGLVYAIDTTLNRIAIYSASGVYQASIPLTGTNASTALAVNAAGYVFTANGDGGGGIYSSSTDSLFGSFSSSAIDGNETQGETSLMVDSNGNLYLYDQTTGFHIFETSEIPEPANWAMFAGSAALLLVGARRRRRGRNRRHTLASTTTP